MFRLPLEQHFIEQRKLLKLWREIRRRKEKEVRGRKIINLINFGSYKNLFIFFMLRNSQDFLLLFGKINNFTGNIWSHQYSVVFRDNYSRKTTCMFLSQLLRGEKKGRKTKRGYCIGNVSTSSHKLFWEIACKREIAKLKHTRSELCKNHLHFHYTV